MAEPTLQSNPVFIDVASTSETYVIACDPEESSSSQYVGAVAVNEEQFPVISVPETNINDIMKNEEKNDTSTSAMNPYTNIQTRRIKCTECSRYTAETEEKMLRHIRKVHRGENPFQCYMCDYSTYNKSLFEEHVRIHQGIKPFKCSHCSYRSASKKNTKKHELIHRPDNPHKCDECGFIARHVRSLNHHLKTHKRTEGQDQICPKCKEHFTNSTAYLNHRKSRKRCSQCDVTFCAKYLKSHLVKEHGVDVRKTKAQKLGEFVCAICKWQSGSKPRILLHLIHHPNQKVDERIVDVRILKDCGIVGLS